MKTLPPSPERSGAVLVFALPAGGGGLVLGGVAQMTATQSVAGETEWTAAERRIKLENSRAMARQYLLSHMFTFTNGSPAVSASNAYGSFELTARNDVGNFWATVSETSESAMLNINPFNLMERGGFYRVWIPGSVSDGMTDVGWNFQVRTRSPLAAGYTFIKHRPSPAPAGLYATPPYMDMETPGAFVGFEGLPRLPVSSVTSTDPWGDTTGFQGYLNVPPGASQAEAFTNVTFVLWTNNSSLQAVLELDVTVTDPGSDLKYDAPSAASYTNASNMVVSLPVAAVVLKGTMNGDYDFPVHVVVDASATGISTLVLSNDNNRRVYVNLQKSANDGSVFRVVATNASEWRLGMTMSKVDVSWRSVCIDPRGHPHGWQHHLPVGAPLHARDRSFRPRCDRRPHDVAGGQPRAMKRGAYSLVEVMVAVAIVGIGMTAAAMLINTLMAQEEVNAASLRAANLQEQAVMLHRLGVDDEQIRALLPEVCGTNTEPAVGNFSIVFYAPQIIDIEIGGAATIPLEHSICTMVFAMPLPGEQAPVLRTNEVDILRPVIR